MTDVLSPIRYPVNDAHEIPWLAHLVGTLDFCNVQMGIHALDGTILKVNSAWRATYGIPADEPIEGLSLFELFGLLLREEIQKGLSETLASNSYNVVRQIPSRRDGRGLGCYKTRLITNQHDTPIAVLVSMMPKTFEGSASPELRPVGLTLENAELRHPCPQAPSAWKTQDASPAPTLPTDRLSVTEAAVLRLILEKRRYAEIASILRIQMATVKTHAMSIRKKLGLRGRSDVPLWRHLTQEG